MALFPDPVRRAINRIATRDGVTIDEIADSFRETEGTDPDPLVLRSTLAALGLTGEVYRDEERRYYTREVGGPGPDVDPRAVQPWRAIDLLPGHGFAAMNAWERELAMILARHRPNRDGRPALGHMIWPSEGGHLKSPTYISYGRQPSTEPPDVLDDFEWWPLNDRAMTASSPAGGEWTLLYLYDSPPNRNGFGRGWYLYGPDVAALPLGDVGAADALNAAERQTRAYIQLERARAEQPATGPLVSDELRAAIHAGHVTQVVIFCDRCGVEHRGDFVGATKEERFEAARRFLENRKGWLCRDDDVCPVCRTS